MPEAGSADRGRDGAPVLAEIRIYPVKGLRGLSLDSRQVEPWGLQGDRRWMLVDPRGRFLTQRELPRLATIDAAPNGTGLTFAAEGHAPLHVPVPPPDAGDVSVTVWRSTVPARLAGPAADAWFSAILGTACRLVHMTDPMVRPVNPEFAQAGDRVSFADGYPLLLATLGSLAELNSRLKAPVPMDRFRPNLVIEGTAPHEEDRWRSVRIGEAMFRLAKPSDRCLVTTIDQRTGERAPGAGRGEPLRTLAQYRRVGHDVLFGQNLIPVTTGRIRLGDRIEVVERAAPA